MAYSALCKKEIWVHGPKWNQCYTPRSWWVHEYQRVKWGIVAKKTCLLRFVFNQKSRDGSRILHGAVPNPDLLFGKLYQNNARKLGHLGPRGGRRRLNPPMVSEVVWLLRMWPTDLVWWVLFLKLWLQIQNCNVPFLSIRIAQTFKTYLLPNVISWSPK